jgi:FAD/FMN-containing dehydrogenase
MCLVVLLTVGIVSFDRYSGAPDAARDCIVHVRAASPDRVAPVVTAEYPGRLSQRGGTVNDASCLNSTPVYGVVRPRTEADVREALAFARAHGLFVSVAGTQHSMGGQASYPNALILDMRGLDRVAVDEARGTVRTGAGATWRRVLEEVHPLGRSVAAMPSIDVLSVGGTVSVNAHGADFRTGSLASTVRSLRLMLADGTVRTVDRTTDPELFRAAIGGYGLFGVILEVELETVDDVLYDFRERTVPTDSFPALFADELVPDSGYRMMYAHLSTSPRTFLDEAIVYTYRAVDGDPAPIPPLREQQDSRVGRLVLNLARHGGWAQRVKWAGERHVLPRFRDCVQPRNEALRAGEACLVSRNQAMYNDLGLLRNKLTQYTDILQEYFLPPSRLPAFIAAAREVLKEHDAELLSASIRSVGRGENLLSYAPGPRLSVVFYLSQEVNPQADLDMRSLTRHLIGLALDHGGTFYLPYQQHYTRAELERAYPDVDAFFALKRARDPGLLFMNSFYGRYAEGSAR